MTKYFFYILAIAPVIGYFLFNIFNLSPYFFIGFVCFILFFLRIASRRDRAIVIPQNFYLLIILFLYYLSWDFYNGRIDELGFIKDVFKWNFNPFYVFAILVIISNTRFEEHFITRIIVIFKITIILAAVVSIIQLLVDSTFLVPKYFETTYNQYFNIYQNRRTSIFGYLGDNEVGLSFVPILSITVGYIMKEKGKGILIWILLGGIVCILSNARYIILGYLIILIQILYFYKKKLKKLIGYFIAFALVGIVLTIMLVRVGNYQIKDYYKERILSESAGSRIIAFDMLIKYFPKYPVFGNGQSLSNEIREDLDGRSSQIHVGYFSHLVSYGIFGSFLLFSFWFYIHKTLWRNAKLTKYYGSYFAFLVFLFANSVMVYYSLFTYGLIFVFIFDKYFSDKYTYNKIINERKEIQ